MSQKRIIKIILKTLYYVFELKYKIMKINIIILAENFSCFINLQRKTNIFEIKIPLFWRRQFKILFKVATRAP